MPYIRSDSDALPTGFGDDDPTIGMGFSIVITICSLAGLLFCFRKASSLMPRNLTIPLQMFGGQNSSNSATRGPIALSDDDLEGATRIDWDELDAQFEDLGGEGGEELVAAGGGGRLLKPMTRQARYLDDDDEDGSQDDGEPYRMTTGADDVDDGDAPFVDDDDEELEAEVEVPGKDAKKDRLFKLDTNESEHEN